LIRYTFFIALVLSGVAFSLPVAGQYSEPVTIEEIQVTATRRPAGRGDVSAALSIIPADEIRALKLTTDALGARTGVYLQQTTPGQGAAIIRGLKGSSILHLVDGLRLNNAIFRNAPTQYLALVSPGSISRIEVLRGAPASLYGTDAVGGVVQVLSRTPNFEGIETEYRRSVFASFDTAEDGRTLRASFDAGNRRIAGLLSVDYLEAGDRRTGSGERIAPTGYRSRGARVALTATPDESQTWLIDFQFAEQPATPRIDELVAGFGQTEPSSSEFLFAPNERQFAHIRHTRAAGWLAADWSVDLGWQRIVDDRITRDFGSRVRRHERNRSDLLGIAVNAIKEKPAGSWIVGGEFYHDTVASRRFEEDLVSGQTIEVSSRFPDDSSVTRAALYANLQRRVGDRHSLSGGIRVSSVEIKLPETPVSAAASLSLNDLSADLGWIYELSERTQLVANIAHGLRAPNIFDMGTLGARPGNRFNIPNPTLNSEHVTQIDAGVRWHTDRSQTELVLYWLQYSDRITSILTGTQTPDGRDIVQSQNLDEADIRGVEASAVLALNDRLSFDAIVNYSHGEEKASGSTAVPADRIPPLNGRLGLRYEPKEKLAVETFFVFADSQTRLGPRDICDVRIDPDGTPGWLTANVRLSWQPDERWMINAAFENLFDEQYRHHGSGIDAVGRNLIVSFEAVW
jgi:outer membrane receptor protein involved in Fe transport